ncbi:MAG TPA: mandelate racemase/muconate lactonizing enzyme family protein [Solirubrobacterales bacterium]|jgi:muconate cycloisomerase
MKLASVEVIPYALPFRDPYVTAAGTLSRREMVLLRLRDEDGVVGLGEAVPLSLRGGAAMSRVVEDLTALERWASIGEAGLTTDPDLCPPARCAALTALLDLRGRRAHREGAASSAAPAPVRCNATLAAGEPRAVAAEAERWAGDGFSTFKLKLGAGRDVEQVRAVREALGSGARIRVDANAAWDVETAKRTLAELEPLDIELAEQPVPSIEEAAAVAGSTSIPLAADESVASRAEAEAAAGAFALTGVKLSKVGGPEAAIEIAEVMPAYVSSALDGPVGIAAAAQVASTLEQGSNGPGIELAHGLATQRLFGSTVASVECEIRDGLLHPPAGPGLGVEIDEEALQAHRI